MTFWNWLQDNTARIQASGNDIDLFSDQITEEINEQFEKEFPNLSWEVEAADEGPWLFIISADCDIEKFGDVIEAYQNAPQIDHWFILPFRQAGSLELKFEAAGIELDASNVWCEIEQVQEEGDTLIDLTLLIPGFSDENEDELAEIGYQLLDNTLGEYDVATMISEISFAAPDEAITGEKMEESEVCFPLNRLPEYVENLQGTQSDEESDVEPV